MCCNEFAKSRAMRAIRASVAYMPSYPRTKSVPTSYFYVPTCLHANKRANVPASQRRANFSTRRANVPSRANILTWRANVPKGVPFFQLSLPNGAAIFQLFFKRIMFFYITNKFIPNIFHIFFIF